MKTTLKPVKAGIYVAIALCFILVFVLNVLLVYPALDNLLDFGSFIASGKAIAEKSNPYQIDSPLIFQLTMPRVGKVYSINLNPPISLLFFSAIANGNSLFVVTIWRALTLFLYSCGILILVKNYKYSSNPTRVIWAFSLAGLWHVLQLGQIYAPLLLAAIGTWLFLEKDKPILAGLCLGVLIAIKPNFVIWAVLLGVARYWSTFIVSGLTASSISVLPIIIYGNQIYAYWLEALAAFQSKALLIPGNNSLQSFMARIGLEKYSVLIIIFLICVLIYITSQFRLDSQKANSLGILLSLLVSPIAWTGYTILCLPIFFAKSKWSWQYLTAAAILMFPYLLILSLYEDSSLNFQFFGSFYLWGLLILLFGVLLDRSNPFNFIRKKIRPDDFSPGIGQADR